MEFELEANYGDDIIYVSEIIARYEWLDNFKANETLEWEEAKELDLLKGFLESLCGYGSDVQWNGNYYPETLIREDHLGEYIKSEAQDLLGAPPHNWIKDLVQTCLDWRLAAEQKKRSGEYGGSVLESLEGGRVMYYYEG